MSPTRSLLAVLLLLAQPGFASVVVVQNGVPNLSTTIDAAAPGDTILVKGGGSGFVITITGKPLTVVVDPPGSFQLSSVRVRDLPAGETCSVSGFALVSSFTALEVTNCAGSVRIADMNVLSMGVGGIGGLVSNSTDVVFARCTLRGGDGQNPSGIPEVALMVAAGSRVAAFDGIFLGGRGANAMLNMVFSTIPAQPGSAAIEVDGTSQFFSSGCSLTAGDGGNGRNVACHITTCLPPSSGAAGGTALESAPGALSTSIGGVLVPGNGGVGGTGGICCGSGSVGNARNGVNGTASAGPLATLMGNAVNAAIPTYARVNQTLPITIVGQPGDEAFLVASLGGQWFLATSLGGVLTPGPFLRRIALGTIPGTGVLQTNLAVPELAGVTEAFLLHAQPVTVSPTFERHVGPGQTVCWLGPTY